MPGTMLTWPGMGILPGRGISAAVQLQRGEVYVWRCTAGNEIYCFGVVPSDYAGGTLTIKVTWAAVSATSGVCPWACQVARINGQDIDNASLTFGTISSTVSTTAPGTAGVPAVTTLTLSTSGQKASLVAGDAFILRVLRDAGGTMSGDADVIAVDLSE